MRFARFLCGGRPGLAVVDGERRVGWFVDDPEYPGDLETLLAGDLRAIAAILAAGRQVDPAAAWLPPLARPGKILCLGLNYAAHAEEIGRATPPDLTIFARVATGLVGHGAALFRPRVSGQLDYEGEMVAVIGRPGRHIPLATALDHVAAYSVFNDGSVRDVQMRTSQWTMGKNFDGTGAFGPALVTADELPPGGRGLALETRLNGVVVQSANTELMIHDVASAVALLSEAMTLETGDVLVMGTPAGVGLARDPPLWMKPGDVCEVEIEGIGLLRNPVVDE